MNGIAINLISSNKLQDRQKKSIKPCQVAQNKHIIKASQLKQASRHSMESIKVTETKSTSSQKQSKVKKRGNSETVHSESANRINLMSQGSQGQIAQNVAWHYHGQRGSSMQNTGTNS